MDRRERKGAACIECGAAHEDADAFEGRCFDCETQWILKAEPEDLISPRAVIATVIAKIARRLAN